MAELPYRAADELVSSTRASLERIFGHDSYAAKLLLGNIVGNATLDGLGVIDMSPKDPAEYGHDQEPHYAERAIRTNDPLELTGLLTEAADRLSRCVPPDYILTTPEQESAGEVTLYARHMLGDGTEEDTVLGGFHVHLSPKKSAEDIDEGHYIAKLEYEVPDNGKEWPTDAMNRRMERLTIFQRVLTDPFTGQKIVTDNVYTGYDMYTRSNSWALHEGFGVVTPVDAKIKAELFFHLDETINYYEALRKGIVDGEEYLFTSLDHSYRMTIFDYLERLQDIIQYEALHRR